jgi:Tfp pilus assembly protein PilO
MTRRYAIAGAAALAVVLIFFLFLLKPKFGQIADVRKQVQTERAQTTSLQIRLRELQASAQNDGQTLDRLSAVNRLLPATPDLPALIRELQTAATISGMDLLSIAPSPPAALANATGVESVSVNLQVNGGFFRLETFLTRLEDKLRRVVQVQSLAISPATDPLTGLTTLSTTLTFEMYVVQDNARVSGSVPVAPRPAVSPAASSSPTPTPTNS